MSGRKNSFTASSGVSATVMFVYMPVFFLGVGRFGAERENFDILKQQQRFCHLFVLSVYLLV
jgi:hypothetical protein